MHFFGNLNFHKNKPGLWNTALQRLPPRILVFNYLTTAVWCSLCDTLDSFQRLLKGFIYVLQLVFFCLASIITSKSIKERSREMRRKSLHYMGLFVEIYWTLFFTFCLIYWLTNWTTSSAWSKVADSKSKYEIKAQVFAKLIRPPTQLTHSLRTFLNLLNAIWWFANRDHFCTLTSAVWIYNRNHLPFKTFSEQLWYKESSCGLCD